MIFAENRKKTKQILVGDVKVGGFAPVSVQSMTNTFTQDVKKTVSQVKLLEEAGCEIVRVAVPDEDAAKAFQAFQLAYEVLRQAEERREWKG